MRNRKKKKQAARYRPLVTLVVLALALPVWANWLWQHGPSLGRVGEQAAVVAAAITMPEEGMNLLRERFEDQLYQGAEESSRPQPQTHVPPATQPTLPEATGEPPHESGQDMPLHEENSADARVQPKIPAEYRASIVSENFAVSDSVALVKFGAGQIKNDSNLSNEEVEAILETPFDLGFTHTDEPQVLIVHTHATEAFERYDSEYYDTRNTWRSRDNNMNMVSVGAAMAEVLEDNGIGVLHDTTQHDYPSYNGSYERSAQTIQSYLEEYPSIKVVLDLHRDAMERENSTIVKPVTEIGGKKAAQIMIIAAADDTGSLGVPEYRKNLRFAAAFQSYMASEYPELTRPVFFSYRKYNMDLTPGSLLLEFGSNANTLEEAVYAAQMAGQALADLILDHME